MTGAIVLDEFRTAIAQHGVPASTLTDNGMVFTTRLSGGKGGRNAFEAELRRLGVKQKNSRPNHPTTCGKVERFQQTLKRWLTAQAAQPDTIAELHALLEIFVAHYNHERPHRSLPERCTPAEAYHRRPKATAGDRGEDTHARVRHDTVDKNGKITLRVDGRMHHIGLGAEHRRTRVIILSHDLDVRVINDTTGELIRKLTIDPGQGLPTPRPTARPQTPPSTEIRVQRVSDVSRHHKWSWRESNPRPSSGYRPCYDHSRVCGLRLPHRRVGWLLRAGRLVFPWRQRSFSPSAVFPAVNHRFCCRAAVVRPRVPLLVAMSLTT